MTTIGTTGTAKLHAAHFAMEGLASFVIIAAVPRFARGSASSISRPAGKATTVGYGDFKRAEEGRNHATSNLSDAAY